MKTISIPLVILLAMFTLLPSARATLCEQCRGMSFIASIGHCKVCADGETTSGAFKLCQKCSAKLAQCEACQQALPAKKDAPPGGEAPPAKAQDPAKAKEYPAHWGAPPRVQTRDLRPLPGGYGRGSSTLAGWIQKNLDQDAKAPADPKKEKTDNAEEIQKVEKKIAELEEFATRARFTPEGLKNHQAAIAALQERLKELQGAAKPK